MSSMTEMTEYLKSLYTKFDDKSGTDKAVAVLLPIICIVTIVFAILIINLLVRKRALKAKLNKTPEGSPCSDSEVSIEKADIIPRPSSVV